MSVPWFIGSNGALHSPEVARLLSHLAANRDDGVIGFGDMKVAALAVPGAAVQIVAGACALTNRSAGALYQTYLDRESNTLQVNVAATGGVARADLIIRRVEDPDYPGWGIPVDPVNGPYGRYAVISGVPATTKTAKQLNLGYPAIALARINMPASTGSVQAGYITDLRKLCSPRRQRAMVRVDVPVGPNDLVAAGGAGNWPPATTYVDVPEWATHAFIRADVSGARLMTSALSGALWVRFGSTVTVDTDSTSFNEQVVGDSRLGWNIGSLVAIPLSFRDTNQAINVWADAVGGSGGLRSDAEVDIAYDIEFVEQAI